jgi:hypothetical protein
VVTAVLLVAGPGLVYLVLAPAARRLKPAALGLCYVLLATQAIVLAIMLVVSMAATLGGGNRIAFTLTVIVLGTPLAVIGYTTIEIARLRRLARLVALVNRQHRE